MYLYNVRMYLLLPDVFISSHRPDMHSFVSKNVVMIHKFCLLLLEDGKQLHQIYMSPILRAVVVHKRRYK